MPFTTSTKTFAMCEVMLALHLSEGQFTESQVIRGLRQKNHGDARSDIQARLKRLVTHGVAKIANEVAVSAGEERIIKIVPDALIPYMRGDRDAYLAALNNTAQPDLFSAWGISIPPSVHRKYPHARVHKQSWN